MEAEMNTEMLDKFNHNVAEPLKHKPLKFINVFVFKPEIQLTSRDKCYMLQHVCTHGNLTDHVAVSRDSE
jgi:hypothetical protein